MKEIVEKSNKNNPFEKAGGSDDEDNKERISIKNRFSNDENQEYRLSVGEYKSLTKKSASKLVDDEELEEIEKLYETEKEKAKNLEEELKQYVQKAESSKATKREEEIERLKKTKGVDLKSSEDETSSQGSKASFHSINTAPNAEICLMGDNFTSDYVRNIFGKYLIYIANKKEKKAKTCENILFTLLSIQEDQIKQINKARKKNSFWDFFRNIRGGPKAGLDMGELDMNLNFSMTDIGDNYGNMSNIGGFPGDPLYGYKMNDKEEKKINKDLTAKRKKAKKGKKEKAENSAHQEISLNDKEIAIKNTQ